MHELKAPREFAGLRAQRHDRIRPFVVTGPAAAVIIGARAAGRHVYQVARLVDRHDGPRVGGAGLGRDIGRQRVPLPALGAGARVERADHAARHARAIVVVDRGADDDEAVDDHRRRRHVIQAGLILGDGAQADLSLRSEIAARRAGRRVESDQTRIERRLEQPSPARLARAPRGIEPRRDAAVDQAVAVVALLLDERIVGPPLAAGFGIERDDAIEAGSQIQRAVNDERCRLEAGALASPAAVRDVTGVIRPGDGQAADVLARDLRERGVAHAARVVPVERPVARHRRGQLRRKRGGDGHTGGREKCPHRSLLALLIMDRRDDDRISSRRRA